jgi:hypothetical protein
MRSLEAKIYETKDYSLFVSEKTNRGISRSHVLKLTESVKSRNLLQDAPILVSPKINGRHYVIDGQHRLQACIDLKIPVWYKIAMVSNTDDVKTFNVYSKNWMSIDFLNYYVEKNNINYIKFKKFYDWSGLRSVDACIKLFSGKYEEFVSRTVHDCRSSSGIRTSQGRGASLSIEFKRGAFIYPQDDSLAKYHINQIKELASCLLMDKWDNVSLWAVYFNVILNTPGFDHSRMVRQLSKYPVLDFKKGFPNADVCVDCLNEIYNKGVKYEQQFLFNRNKLHS